MYFIVVKEKKTSNLHMAGFLSLQKKKRRRWQCEHLVIQQMHVHLNIHFTGDL